MIKIICYEINETTYINTRVKLYLFGFNDRSSNVTNQIVSNKS